MKTFTQLSLFDLVNQNNDLLPEFAETKRRLEAGGHPSEWITETVNPADECAHFLKAGKPWYRSSCPMYEGFWLCGYIGSVQCQGCEKLIPGLQYNLACKDDFERCRFYKKPEAGGSEK